MKKPRKTSPDLLRCPFCGKLPTDVQFCGTERGPVLMCPHCGAQGPFAFKETVTGSETEAQQREAMKAWNRRTPAP